MTNMISMATGFQSSVNIAYDINDESKIKKYIPTKSALKLLEEVLLSTSKNSTDRAQVLIGAYGKGKSHIVLMILSILMKKDLSLFEKMLPIIEEEQPKLYQLIENYYNNNKKILPVVISGSGTSLTQLFMLALQHTLAENELTDIMPETNYQSAITTIERWDEEFPDTYKLFQNSINDSVDNFKNRLSCFDNAAYSEFEEVYPQLTAGSKFNPFIGLDVADLFEKVAKALEPKGYSGIFVVYDEFSKYLENNISGDSKNDTKMLQDFAEKCARSGSVQLHIMLISHKELTSYMNRASKAMVDGWRGVSERFHHVYMNNNFTQTYEIIAAAIEKDSPKWEKFVKKHNKEFAALRNLYDSHTILSDSCDQGAEKIILDCYPLHPVSTFILPRLSERVAQNERTLFTFISATGDSTLPSFLKKHSEDSFVLATPDLIYDYFEPLLKQEVYSGNLHKYYTLTSSILRKIEPNSLDAKIVKTLALIYILGQFEKLQPTVNELSGIYETYGVEQVKDAIKRLVEDKYVIYLKRSNGYLRLKEASGVDIRNQISDMVGKRSSKLDIKTVLNEMNFDHYLYPSRYNDDKDMIRYFDFKFINSSEVRDDIDWKIKRDNINADGVAFAIVVENDKELASLKDTLMSTSVGNEDCVFVVPTSYQNVSQLVAEYDAVQMLMQTAGDDPVLFEDYEVVYDEPKRYAKGVHSKIYTSRNARGRVY